MRKIIGSVVMVLLLVASGRARAQAADSNQAASVPRLISVSGVFQPANGQPPAVGTVVTLSLYADQTGGALLWQEMQTVTVDSAGRFTLLLGATQPEGVPLEIFASGEARWLGMQFAGAGEVERPRIQILSVPYALRAADAATLGGHPASAYVLAPTGTAASGNGRAEGTASTSSSNGAPSTSSSATNGVGISGTGTVNALAKFVDATDVGSSAVYESLGSVGVGTAAPLDFLHVKFSNTGGTATGLAVQNTGNTGAPYSGMLFYDQNGAVAQFQGFNNLTHEYRINNVASLGSINFMLNSASRFLVSGNGSVGVGTAAPDSTSNLDVSNAVTGSGSTNLQISAYAANGFGSNLIGKKARGTQAAPTSVLNNDGLLTLSGTGYGATGFAGVSSGVISMRAAENWTDTAQGSYMNFATTANGTTGNINRMTINSNGNIGIGVFGAQAPLEVSNQNGVAGAGMIFTTTFTNAGTSLFVGRRARGTGAAPSAVLAGDNLAGYLAQGHTGTAGFSGTRGGMFVSAAENWSATAQGTSLNFNTTATGTVTPGTKMTIDPSGNVGIGTFAPQASLEVSRDGHDAAVATTVYTDTNPNNANPVFFTRFANGTQGAPSAVQSGQILGGWIASGYGATQFGDVVGGMGVLAMENFTDIAQGVATGFLSTPLGSVTPALHMAVLPSGFVGIGDWAIPGGTPTAADRLQVFGDIRVGTSGTNGCLNNFAGTGLIGVCASDRRFKKNITPFGSVLDQVTALQPVHFNWRATEFPDRHWGDSRAYGLIAQDVEEVLPELVVTNEDGYKAVDYSKLPLLTIQAVKQLKTENDTLKDRVAELERIVSELIATSRR